MIEKLLFYLPRKSEWFVVLGILLSQNMTGVNITNTCRDYGSKLFVLGEIGFLK